MDDSIINKIKSNISNDLSKINSNIFLSKIKNSLSVNECISISNEFIESFKEIKSNILLYISNELNNIKHSLEEKDVSNNILKNEILILYNNIKNIITQNKSKIKNINSNINDIYSNINLINSNIEKKKYSLVSSRISKIISIKNNLLSHIKQLETEQQKILDEFGYDKNTKLSNSTIKVRPAPTPFPITSIFNFDNNNNLDKNNRKRNINNNNLNNNIIESAKKKLVNYLFNFIKIIICALINIKI